MLPAADVIAVSSRASDDYIREKLPDGSFKPEAYCFGEGGHLAGMAHDETIDDLRFTQIARVIAAPLANHNYTVAKDPEQTRLLIMVYWGTTTGTAENPALHGIPTHDAADRLIFTPQRERDDFRNAQLLGYDSDGLIGTDFGRHLLSIGIHGKTADLLDDVEDNRYFVVLMAYDFQLLWKQKKRKLLWETRFSILENRNDFQLALPEMTRYASRYFGTDSHGLIRKPVRENIKLGEFKVLGVDEEKK